MHRGGGETSDRRLLGGRPKVNDKIATAYLCGLAVLLTKVIGCFQEPDEQFPFCMIWRYGIPMALDNIFREIAEREIEGWPEPYMYTVYYSKSGKIPAINSVYTP